MWRHERPAFLLSLMMLLAPLPAFAGQGAAELSLDRTAVKDLLTAALPAPWKLEVPGVGAATLRLLAPRRVEFSDGGIDLTLPLEIVEAGWTVNLVVRLVPDVEPTGGQVRLVPESVRPEAGISFPVDLAQWMAALELPRRLDWSFPMRARAELHVGCYLQGIAVTEDRLVLQLGVALRREQDAPGR